MRFAGAERGSRVLQILLNLRCERMRATKHAPRDPFSVLERRHGLAQIVEGGGRVHAERMRVIPSHPTMFTHWPDGKQAVTKILKIEDNLDAALASTLAEFGLGRRRRLQPLGRNAKSSKRGAFCGPDRCDACALLAETRHTPATIRIVDRLYARDFELLGKELRINQMSRLPRPRRDFHTGYQKINARMMRLCGQRAARQAALASQNRRPVVRRKPKKYRGPTRTPPAKRNDKPQEEEFGRHMKKWLEGEQVPLMPTE